MNNIKKLLEDLNSKSNFAELYALILGYIIDNGIDSLEKLKEALANKNAFCDSFVSFIPYKSEKYKEDNKKAALAAYEYLNNYINKSNDKPPFAYQYGCNYRAYDYDYYDIDDTSRIMQSLKSTDNTNTVAALLLNLPINEPLQEFREISAMTIAEIKAKIKDTLVMGRI